MEESEGSRKKNKKKNGKSSSSSEVQRSGAKSKLPPVVKLSSDEDQESTLSLEADQEHFLTWGGKLFYLNSYFAIFYSLFYLLGPWPVALPNGVMPKSAKIKHHHSSVIKKVVLDKNRNR